MGEKLTVGKSRFVRGYNVSARRRAMKAVFQRRAQKKGNPLVGMLVVLASICAVLAFLVLVTVVVLFIVM